MSKLLVIILVAVLLAVSFAVGRWTAPSAQPLNSGSGSAPALSNKTCSMPSLPPVVVKPPAPFEGKTSDELYKKLADNKKRILSAATQDEQRQ